MKNRLILAQQLFLQETHTCEEANFIDIRVKRFKEADYLYKGSAEIDWYDEETRVSFVRDFGWRCYGISWECERCVARRYCAWFEEEDETENDYAKG